LCTARWHSAYHQLESTELYHPAESYMQDNAALWKVGRVGGDDSDSSGSDTDENIGEEEGKYKKLTFFLMLQEAVILK